MSLGPSHSGLSQSGDVSESDLSVGPVGFLSISRTSSFEIPCHAETLRRMPKCAAVASGRCVSRASRAFPTRKGTQPPGYTTRSIVSLPSSCPLPGLAAICSAIVLAADLLACGSALA